MLDYNNISLYFYVSKFMIFFTHFSSWTKFSVLDKRLKALFRFSERYFKDPCRYILLLPPCVQQIYYEEDPNDLLHFFKSKRLFFCLLHKVWYFLKYIHLLNPFEKKLYLDFIDFIFVYWVWAEKNKSFYKLYNIDKKDLSANATNKHCITHTSLNNILTGKLEKLLVFKELNFFNIEIIKYIFKYLDINLNFKIEEIYFAYQQLRPLRRRRRKYRYDKHKELRKKLRKEREELRAIRIAEELKLKEENRKKREELRALKRLEKDNKKNKI